MLADDGVSGVGNGGASGVAKAARYARRRRLLYDAWNMQQPVKAMTQIATTMTGISHGSSLSYIPGTLVTRTFNRIQKRIPVLNIRDSTMHQKFISGRVFGSDIGSI